MSRFFLLLILAFFASSLSASAAPPPTQLRAGPLTCEYEQGVLRHVYLGHLELAREISFTVGEAPLLCETWLAQVGPKEFELTIRARQSPDHSPFDIKIAGSSSGEIVCLVLLNAAREIPPDLTLRVDLDSTTLSGSRAEITTAENASSSLDFPRSVASAPITNSFVSLRRELAPSMEARLRLEGGAFSSIEDLRKTGRPVFQAVATLDLTDGKAGGIFGLNLSVLGAGLQADAPVITRVRLGDPLPAARLPRILRTPPEASHTFQELLQTDATSKADPVLAVSLPSFPSSLRLAPDSTALLDQIQTLKAQNRPVKTVALQPAPQSGDARQRSVTTALALKAAALAALDSIALPPSDAAAQKTRQLFAPYAGAQLLEVRCTGPRPPRVEAFAIARKEAPTLWLINRCAELQQVEVENIRGPIVLAPWEIREVNLPRTP